MTMSRSTVVLVLVIVTAVALGAVVAVHGGGSPTATAMGTYGSGSAATNGLADTSSVAANVNTPTGVDPAKQEPVLNLFHSRDPFIQATSAPASSGGITEGQTTSPSPSPSASASSVPHAADIMLVTKSGSHTYNDQQVGDKLPPSSSLFQIVRLSSAGVQFKLLNGYALQDGSTTFAVPTGTAGTQLILQKSGGTQTTVTIKVLQILYDTSGGGKGGGSGSGSGGSGSGSGSGSSSSTGSGGTSVSGHAIKALSIDTKNGVASATIVVDGTTYANKKVGDTFATGWGHIKIVGINAPGQTVTILHADVQLTLHVGQSYSK